MAALADSAEFSDDAFAWDDLLESIVDDHVVPAIGHELLEADYDGTRTTLQALVARRLAEAQRFTFDARLHFELADAVAAFLERPRVRPDDAYLQVNRVVTN